MRGAQGLARLLREVHAAQQFLEARVEVRAVGGYPLREVHLKGIDFLGRAFGYHQYPAWSSSFHLTGPR